MSDLTYTEDVLLRRFRDGEDDAFTEVYDRFYFIVYQYAKRWVINRQDAEDVASETFMKLLARREQMDSFENIAGFLKLAARNACFNRLKHNQVKAAKQADLLRLISLETEPDFTWVEIREEFLHLIYVEVDKMPKKMKEIFLLSYKQGLKPSEIARKLGLSVQTVSNHKTNAIKLLKTALVYKFLFLALFVSLGK